MENEKAELREGVVTLPPTEPFIKRANKRFLENTMRAVVTHNDRTVTRRREQSKRLFQDLCKVPSHRYGERKRRRRSSSD